MTRLQRALHRRIWLALLMLIPVLCGVALRARHTRAAALASAGTSAGARP